MAYDILTKARKPLHVTELLERMGKSFRVTVDRESLVSALTKKVMRGDRFIRTEIIARGRKDAKLCKHAPAGSRRFYDINKFTPEEIRKDDAIPWRTTKILCSG